MPVPQYQESNQPVKKRKKEHKLEFDAGKVFYPGENKADDFELDLESAHYRAEKGEAGNRSD